MFYDTEIEVLPNPEGLVLKTIHGDFQPYNKVMNFDHGVSLELSHRVFCDPDPTITIESYFKVGRQLYKVLYIKEWPVYLEIYLYHCERQV